MGCNCLPADLYHQIHQNCLGSTKMKTLMNKLVERYDFVILDSPAVLLATDAAVLSVHADATLLVAWAGKSRKVNLRQAAEQLREVNANLMGCVLNGVSAKDIRARYYHDDRVAYEVSQRNNRSRKQRSFLPSMSRFQLKKMIRRTISKELRVSIGDAKVNAYFRSS